jgi:hypothetical protein
MERMMHNRGEQLFTAEFTGLWSSAQQRRGEFVAAWFARLRDRVRAAMRMHRLGPKLDHLELGFTASVRSQLAVDMQAGQGA